MKSYKFVIVSAIMASTVLILGLGIFGSWVYERDQETDHYTEVTNPATQLNEAVKAKNYKKAYALMTPGYQKSVTLANFEAFFRSNGSIFPGTFELQEESPAYSAIADGHWKWPLPPTGLFQLKGEMTGSGDTKVVTFIMQVGKDSDMSITSTGDAVVCHKIDQISIERGAKTPP